MYDGICDGGSVFWYRRADGEKVRWIVVTVVTVFWYRRADCEKVRATVVTVVTVVTDVCDSL